MDRMRLLAAVVLSLGLPSGRAGADDRTALKDVGAEVARRLLDEAEEIEDPKARAGHLDRVAAFQARLGDREEARATWERAIATLEAVEDDGAIPDVAALLSISGSQASVGDREAALATLRRARDEALATEDVARKVQLLLDILARQRAIGGDADTDETYRRAMEVLEPRDEPAPRVVHPVTRLIFPARAGRFREALRDVIETGPVDRLDTESVRAMILRSMAESIRSEDRDEAGPILDDARSLVYGLTSPFLRGGTLSSFARAELRLGDIDDAARIAVTMPEDFEHPQMQSIVRAEKAIASLAVAEAMVRAGRRDEAREPLAEILRIAEGLKDEDEPRDSRSTLIERVAATQAAAGDIEATLRTLAKLDAAAPGRPEPAPDDPHSPPSDWGSLRSAIALDRVARERHERGDAEMARNLTRRHLSWAEGVLRNVERSHREESEVARWLRAQPEMPPKVLELLQENQRLGRSNVSFVHAAIAVSRARLGDVAAAVEAARPITEPDSMILAMLAINDALVASGDPGTALAWVDGLDSREQRVLGLFSLAGSIARQCEASATDRP